MRAALCGAALLLAEADQPAARRGLEAAVTRPGEEDQEMPLLPHEPGEPQ